MFLPYIIVNAAHLCSASLFNGQDLNSECTKDPHSPFLPICPLAFESVCVGCVCKTDNFFVCGLLFIFGCVNAGFIEKGFTVLFNYIQQSICQFTHWSNPPVIQHIAHISLCCLTVLLRQLRTAPNFILALRLLYMKAHSINLSVYWGSLNSLSGTARLSSEELIPQQIATLWIASFLLFWASAIFFRSYDWSQISHSMFLTCSRDFK